MSARRSSIQSIQTTPKWLFNRLDPRPHKKEKFLALCTDIRGALEDSMCPPGDLDRRFVSADALNTVWLSREGRPASRLDSFHQQLTKIERDPGITEKHLRLLSILLWIFYPYEGWREFARAFAVLSISDRRGWQDEQLPFPDAKPLHSLFESQIDFDAHAQNFLRSQYLFSPARISELRLSDCDTATKSLPEGTRLPFVDAGKMLNHGTHKVTRRKVARGGIETLSGDPLDVVAVKTFSADQKGQFVNELRNLKQLKKASSIHPNIQSCFSAIKIGSTGHLIFEAAECNLSQILHWQEAFSATFCADIRRDLKPGFLLWEAKDLSDALNWLHKGFGTKNSPDRFKCYHLDLKPDNILVFPSSYADLPDDIWTWKIADFGGSVIKHMGNISNSESGLSASELRLRTGIYQAPEIASAQYDPGTAADIWSFGCILLEILAFAHGGPGGVKGLERVRNSNNKPHFYADSTFTLREDVRAWIDGLDIVDAGLQGFRDLIYKLLGRDPEDRPTAHDLKDLLDFAWNGVRMGANDLIFPTPSEASTSEQATDIEMPTNDPPLIHMIDGPQPVCHQIKKELRKTPSKCRISTNGSHAIVQMRSERNCLAFSMTPRWNERSPQEPRNLLTEEETHKYDVEKVAVEDTFCAALIRTVGGEDFQVGHMSMFYGLR
ncbi:hypothetical protein SLS55_010695 [Diplodia seriata]|uniref:non-specific serine/threonine protein kinase n=1 Tax=Diplodia seriata TaxID=420778 RepID=A0ABR3BV47_9PEZI